MKEKYQFVDGTQIKLLAVVLMFLDHIHEMFSTKGAPMWLTMLGRVVFPLFLFMSAEAFFYTRSKKKYIARLIVASICMVILTTTTQSIFPSKDNIGLMNNAFSTFAVTAIYMFAWDFLKAGFQEKKGSSIGKGIVLALIPILACIPMILIVNLVSNSTISPVLLRIAITLAMMIPNILLVEGGFIMVVLGLLFYIFRKNRWIQIIVLVVISGVIFICSHDIQWMMVFAAIPMLFYNGKKGKGMKNFFYIFYPVHIILLYILSTLI